MFQRIDSGDDKKISYDEFVQAIPEIEKMGFKVLEPAKTFASIDTNGGGQITFDEFSHWAIKAQLDLVDDDNFEDKEISSMK